MLDLPASMQEVSRQLWALFGGLVKEHADTKRLVANVLKIWCARIFLPKVTTPP